MREREPPLPPPTVGYLRGMGLTGLFVTCDRCQHSEAITFDALTLPADLAFPAVKQARRFVCSRCSGRAVFIMPDWRGHHDRDRETAAVGRTAPPSNEPASRALPSKAPEPV